MEKKKVKSEVVDRIRRRTSLETKLQVDNEMAFISLLSDLGYREDKMWTPEEDETLTKLLNYAKEHTKYQLKMIEKHLALRGKMDENDKWFRDMVKKIK